MTLNDPDLSTKQRRAIACLLTARSIAEAAQQAGISEKTIDRWLRDETFRAELEAAEGALIAAAARRLVSAQGAAIDAIESIIGNTQIHASIRLRAALGALDAAIKLRELRNLEERLSRLERAEQERDESQH